VCETKQTIFLNDAIGVHGDKYLYDKVDFCDPNTIIKKEGIGDVETQYKRKVLIGCKVPKHGYFFQDSWSHVNRKTGCPICKQSKGEEYIDNLLSSKFGGKITIKRENDSEFSQLGSKRFDFYIPELKLVIEYDGIGHFEPTFGTSDFSRNKSYNDVFVSDNLKNSIIRSKKINKNGIRLIRIPYVMNFNEIDKPLLQAIKNTPPNEIAYLGTYPRRYSRKEPESQFKLKESKLSLINIVKKFK
jgi:very-short-patch-repair endonuclease